jgi:putative ABC transport system permease protein
VEIVGVTRDIQQLGPEVRSTPAFFFLPSGTWASCRCRSYICSCETTLPPARVAASVRREVIAAGPEQPVADVETLEGVVADALAGPPADPGSALRFLGGSADPLRPRDLPTDRPLGHRPAAGDRGVDGARSPTRPSAEHRDAAGFRWVLIGLAAGLAAAFLLARTLSGALYAVSARDPIGYLIAPLLLNLIALLACYLPARGAARMEPAVTLRAEG